MLHTFLGKYYPAYDHTGRGRIWIIWNSREVEVDALGTDLKFLHCSIKVLELDTSFDFTAIYGLHTIEHRRRPSDGLKMFDSSCSNPWLIMGDFNAVLKPEDRTGGLLRWMSG